MVLVSCDGMTCINYDYSIYEDIVGLLIHARRPNRDGGTSGYIISSSLIAMDCRYFSKYANIPAAASHVF